jgi:hypothetical protein
MFFAVDFFGFGEADVEGEEGGGVGRGEVDTAVTKGQSFTEGEDGDNLELRMCSANLGS